MNKINPLAINSLNFSKRKGATTQSFGNKYVPNYAPAPVFYNVPYGINQVKYVKLGVDKLPLGQEIHLYRLSNGQNVQIIKKDGGTSVVTKVNAGAFDEKGYPKGIAHFIEHSVFHGSKSYNTDLTKELNKITTYNNASTSSKETMFCMDLASDSKEALMQALDIQSDMLLCPTFSSIEKEKPIVQSEYQDSMLDDFNIMHENLLKNLFQYSSANEASVAGNDESIDSITKEDMLRFHSNFYKPSNMTTMITSKHNPDEVINFVANNFVSKSPKDFSLTQRQPVAFLDKTTRTDIITNNSCDGHVFLSFVCPNLSNKFNEMKLSALTSLFAMRYLHQMPLLMQNSSIGLLYCSESLSDELKPNEAIQNIYQQIIDFKSKPPSCEEVKEIKEQMLKNFESSFSSGNINVLQVVSDVLNNGGSYITYETYKQMIESLTAQNIYEMTKYLDLNKASIVVSHSKDATDKQIQETDKKYPYHLMPINIAGNSQKVNYAFFQHCNQSTGDKFYSTTLQDGSRVFFVNSPNDNCEISWKYINKGSYSSNPATKFILSNLFTHRLLCGADYFSQGEISGLSTCELKEIDEQIAKMKSFSNIELSQKQFEDAKKTAKKQIDEMSGDVFAQLHESFLGVEYSTSKEYLKQQVDKITIDDVVNDLNNMILNSAASYIVKAPIEKDFNLAQYIANLLNSSNMQFKQPDNFAIQNKSIDYSDCVINVDNANQNKIAQGYGFAVSNNPRDYYIFNLLAKILAAKNYNTIREKLGLAYYSGASFEQAGNNGFLILRTDASCNNKNDLSKIYSQYEKNIAEILNGQITQEEFLLAKNKMKGNLKSYFNDKNASLYEQLHDFAFNDYMIDSFGKTDEIINSITTEDIKNAANYIFKNRPQRILTAKQKLIDENIDFLNTFGKVEKR